MAEDKPERPIDLTHEQIKQRERDAHATVTQARAPEPDAADNESGAEDEGKAAE